MEEVDKYIEIRSEEFREILAKNPSWFLRYGLSLILFITIVFIIGASLFKYPDVIEATIILTGSTPPARIKVKTSGVIQCLYVNNNQFVNAGKYMAVIQNPANVNDVKYIKGYADMVLNLLDSTFSLPNPHLKLGSMQSTFSSLYQSLFDYLKFKEYDYSGNKISVMAEKADALSHYYQKLRSQEAIIKTKMLLSSNDFLRDSLLYQSGVLSLQNFELSKSTFLDSRLSVDNISASIDNIRLQILENKETLLDLNNSFMEKENTYFTNITGRVTQLLSEISEWEMNYVLIAPIDGKVAFSNFGSSSQNVIIGEEFFNITPSDSGKLMAKAFLPMSRYGKVKIGQQTNLHFDNFPNNEYGTVKGIVTNISKVPSTDSDGGFYYTTEISLQRELTTSYNKVLPYYPEMKGTAYIITKDISLLNRILFPLRKIINEGFKK